MSAAWISAGRTGLSAELAEWPSPVGLDDHAQWRPDWTRARPRLCWYLTFQARQLRAALTDVLQVVADVPWLHPVPVEWVHLTVCEVASVERLGKPVLRDLAKHAQRALTSFQAMAVSLGPLTTLPGAVVLAASPLHELRELEDALFSASVDVLGNDHVADRQQPFWPHVSLGYANRRVAREEVDALLSRLPAVSTDVAVHHATLAEVTRTRGHYRWTVAADVAFGQSG